MSLSNHLALEESVFKSTGVYVQIPMFFGQNMYRTPTGSWCQFFNGSSCFTPPLFHTTPRCLEEESWSDSDRAHIFDENSPFVNTTLMNTARPTVLTNGAYYRRGSNSHSSLLVELTARSRNERSEIPACPSRLAH